jgi:exosortase
VTSTSFETKRWAAYFLWTVLCAAIFWKPLTNLAHLAANDESASHILLIPMISAFLLYLDAGQLETTWKGALGPAAAFFMAALSFAFIGLRVTPTATKEQLAAYIVALILLLVAGFIGIFGTRTSRNSQFALAFLLFAVPLPDYILNRIIYVLQEGSADVAEFLFNLSGAPVLRDGFIFRLPRISIEVARECSGIRSSIALLILALLVSHFAFRPTWKKIVFIIAGLLIMLIKNGIRIATLTLLANYVNPEFLTGKLHHQGGIVFFLIGLFLLVPVFWLLQRNEPKIGVPKTALKSA